MKSSFGIHGRASCIINPRAANNKWQRKKRLRRYLQKKLPIPTFGPPQSKEESIRLAKKLSQEHELLIVIGGDGTISDAIQGVIDSRNHDLVLGIIPFGSGNAFRKTLDIPKRIKKAADYLVRGKVKTIDVIEVNGRIGSFINIGATAQVGYVTHSHTVPGLWGHALAARVLPLFRRKKVQVEIFDGLDERGRSFEKKKLDLKILDCIVSKTKHFGYGWKVAPRAAIDDGFLDITFFEFPGWLWVLLYPLIYYGLLQRKLRHFKARRMVVIGDRLPLQYNGEDLPPQDRIELKVLPKAVKFITPPA